MMALQPKLKNKRQLPRRHTTVATEHKNQQLAEFAQYLKAQRINQSRSIHRTAKALSIDREQLVALEEWDESNIMPDAYRVGILNSYAELLGLAPINARKPTIRPVIAAQSLTSPRIVSRWLGRGAVAFAMLVALTYFAWLGRALVAKPTLKLNIANDTRVSSQSVTVSGSTDPQTIVRIDGQPVAIAEDGRFATNVYVRIGQNDITITAINSLGRQNTIVRQVYR